MPRIVFGALAIVCLTLAGCSDSTGPSKSGGASYRDGTEQSHPAENIQIALNRMDAPSYLSQLDDAFVFHFHSGDVGGEVPASWPFYAEEAAIIELLGRGGGTGGDPVESISFALEGIRNAAWEPVSPRAGFAGETWYATTVTYSFRMQRRSEREYFSTAGFQVRLTIREQTDGKWKLVEMRDLADLGPGSTNAPTRVEDTTLGRVKFAYLVPPPPFEDLTREWHVLHNLRNAWNSMNIDQVRNVLDPEHFIFFFSPGDVGGDIPIQWGIVEEMWAVRNMFTGAGGTENNPIVSVYVSLGDVRDVEWRDVRDDPDFPGEVLRRGTVVYDYFIDTLHDRQFITSGGPQAQFTLRMADGKWRIVRWADLEGLVSARASAATEETNWGQIKSLYR